MPMQTFSPCPRPCLKRSSTSPSASDHQPYAPIDPANPLLNIDPSILHPLVHFPPHSAIARTFAAHSPAAYDRSPIVVAPNQCSLPERGCPGRTYEAVDPSQHQHQQYGYIRPPSIRSGSGKHAYPRGGSVAFEDDDDDTTTSTDLTPIATPTIYAHPLPPSLSDTSSSSSSSSSSESDESDYLSPGAESAI
ncbi:hypothetical protein EIP91_004076, partial [Steccherinum ochraceum]